MNEAIHLTFSLGELIGWAGRIGAHYCPYNSTAFSLQISILIIGRFSRISTL